MAVVRPEETPPFGPALEEGQRFLGGSGLRPFLLAKAINGENAAARGGRLGAMAARTRRQYLQELLRAHGAGPPLPATPRGLPTLGGLRRGGSGSSSGGSGGAGGGGAVIAGALVWGARAEGGLPCLLGVAAERVVVVAAPPGAVADRCRGEGVAGNSSGKPPQNRGEGEIPANSHPGEPPSEEGEVTPQAGVVASPPGTLFSCACRDVLGWGFSEGRLEIFHGAGQWLALRLPHGAAPQVVARLQVRAAGGFWGGCDPWGGALGQGMGWPWGHHSLPCGSLWLSPSPTWPGDTGGHRGVSGDVPVSLTPVPPSSGGDTGGLCGALWGSLWGSLGISMGLCGGLCGAL